MASFPGALREPLGLLVPWQQLASELPPSDNRVPGNWLSASDAATLPRGAFQSSQPINFLPRTYVGDVMFSYFDDYYNRVWMVPGTIDFGPITATTYKQVYLWNAHQRPTTLNDIVPPSDTSVTLAGISEGTTFKALGGGFFEAWVNINGDPSVDATFNFDFLPTERTTLRLLAVRSRLWPFPPNWSDPFEVTFDYQTEVITSDSGKEQRRALRQTPRKSFAFSALAHDGDFRQFVRQMSVWQARSTIVPEFSSLVRLSAEAPDGASLLEVDGAANWLVPGKLVVLRHQRNWLLRTVLGVSGNLVSLTTPIDGDWPAATRLYSALSGRLSTQIQTRQHTNMTSVIDVRFSADPGVEPETIVPPATVLYRGREVMTKKPNWANAPTPEFVSKLETLDYGVGRLDYFIRVLFNDRYQKAEYLSFSRADADEMEAFFRRQMGQAGEFFMPTYTEDLRIKIASPATTSNLRIEGTGTAEDYASDSVYRDLIIFFADGTFLMRHVQSVYQVEDDIGADTIIQVDTPWPITVDPANIRQICWLPLCRLASDQLTFQWLTDETTQIAMTIKTLEYRDAE